MQAQVISNRRGKAKINEEKNKKKKTEKNEIISKKLNATQYLIKIN